MIEFFDSAVAESTGSSDSNTERPLPVIISHECHPRGLTSSHPHSVSTLVSRNGGPVEELFRNQVLSAQNNKSLNDSLTALQMQELVTLFLLNIDTITGATTHGLFEEMKNMMRGGGCNLGSRLQLYSGAAYAARSCGLRDLSRSLLNSARTIADSFSEPSAEFAAGLEVLCVNYVVSSPMQAAQYIVKASTLASQAALLSTPPQVYCSFRSSQEMPIPDVSAAFERFCGPGGKMDSAQSYFVPSARIHRQKTIALLGNAKALLARDVNTILFLREPTSQDLLEAFGNFSRRDAGKALELAESSLINITPQIYGAAGMTATMVPSALRNAILLFGGAERRAVLAAADQTLGIAIRSEEHLRFAVYVVPVMSLTAWMYLSQRRVENAMMCVKILKSVVGLFPVGDLALSSAVDELIKASAADFESFSSAFPKDGLKICEETFACMQPQQVQFVISTMRKVINCYLNF